MARGHTPGRQRGGGGRYLQGDSIRCATRLSLKKTEAADHRRPGGESSSLRLPGSSPPQLTFEPEGPNCFPPASALDPVNYTHGFLGESISSLAMTRSHPRMTVGCWLATGHELVRMETFTGGHATSTQ